MHAGSPLRARESEQSARASDTTQSESFLSRANRSAGLQRSLVTAWQLSGLIPMASTNGGVSGPGDPAPPPKPSANGGVPRHPNTTPEEAARAAAAAAAAVRPPPSIVVSAKQPSKLKRRIGGFWGRSKGPLGAARKGNFNPEELTSQKRQWAKLQKQGLEARQKGEPTHLFEHFVVVGLPPTADVAATEAAFAAKKAAEKAAERAEKLGDEDGYLMYKGSAGTSLQPEVLFKYPPGKRLALKDLPGFCFPNGVQARVMERTPSMSELNEVIYGQSYQKKDDQSFVFLLKVADNVTLYGVCVLVHEMVQRPPGVLAMSMAFSPAPPPPLSKYLVSAPRCYCILTQYPFFDLHFEVLYNVLAQERLDRITACVSEMVLVEQSSPMVKVSSRQRIASPARSQSGEDDPNEWMDSAIPVDEVLGNTLTSQGFRIEDRPRSPSVTHSPTASPLSSPARESIATGMTTKSYGENSMPNVAREPANGIDAEKQESSRPKVQQEDGAYRGSRLSSVSTSGNRELRSEPSLVEMVAGDTSNGIPVEGNGNLENRSEGLHEMDSRREGTAEACGIEGYRDGLTQAHDDADFESISLAEDSGQTETSATGRGSEPSLSEKEERQSDAEGVSDQAGSLGQGGSSESGQYKAKRPPAIAVVHAPPLAQAEIEVSAQKRGPDKPSSESGSQKHGEDGSALNGSEAFAAHAVAASLRPPAHHTRMNSVDSAYSMEGGSATVSIDGSTEADEEGFFTEAEDFGAAAALAWAEANGNDSLQIVCAYHKLGVPPRGGSVVFQPLDHLQPLAYSRPAVIPASLLGGRSIDLMTCKSKVDLMEAQSALMAGEEALAVSVWSVATLCRALSLENVLAMLVAALLEKQVVVICPNLGVLSAIVLSIIPLLRPFMWQCLLLPLLPSDLLGFLEAPVPLFIGVQHKTAEVRSKIAPLIRVNVYKNKVKMTSAVPPLPKAKQLAAALQPFHEKLAATAGESRRRPAFKTTEAQARAVEGFLVVLRGYLESLCSDLRSHTITDVGASGDRVSLLLKDSFVDSFSHKDRPFVKVFVETQMFSVYTDSILSAQDR